MRTDRVGDHAREQLHRRARRDEISSRIRGSAPGDPPRLDQSRATTTGSMERTRISSSTTTGWSSTATCFGATRQGSPDQNLARRFQTGWRDDELTVNRRNTTRCCRISIPEVGFVRRGDISQYSGELTWAPRDRAPADPEPDLRHDRRLLRAGVTRRIETRVQEANAGIRFRNNGSTNFTAARTFDRLFEPFESAATSRFRSGDYEYTNYISQLQHRQRPPDHWERQRRLGRVMGREQQIGCPAPIGWRPDYHFSFDANYSRNHVTLPKASSPRT